MKTSDEILSLINEYLDNLPYERKPAGLYDPIKYVLSIGGKRWLITSIKRTPSAFFHRLSPWKPIITIRYSMTT